MIGLISAFFVASGLLSLLFYLRKLIKSMSKKQRKKFVKRTILADILLIVLFAGLNIFWKNSNAMDAVALSLMQGEKTAFFSLFCIIQAYVGIVLLMSCIYINYEPKEEDYSDM